MNRPADGERTPFQGLPKAFRLKKTSLIRPMFDRSRDDVGSIATGSIRLLYRIISRAESGNEVPLQVGFAPGRRNSAVRRNRIKRLLREVYRIEQQDLIDLFSDTPRMLTLMVLYRGDAPSPDDAIRRDLPRALKALVRRLSESSMIAEQR